MELVGLLGVAALVLEHLGGDDADAVDLLIQLGVVDVRVDGADLIQNGVLRVLRRLLLGGLLLLLGGIGDAVAGEHQAVIAVVQIALREESVVQHVLQRVPHFGGGGPQGGGQGGDRDGGPAADHGQIAAESAHPLLPAQAAPQAAQPGSEETEDGDQFFQIPGDVWKHPQISKHGVDGGEAKDGGEHGAHDGQLLCLGRHLGQKAVGGRHRAGVGHRPGLSAHLRGAGAHAPLLLLHVVGVAALLLPAAGQLDDDHQNAYRGEHEEEEQRQNPEAPVAPISAPAGAAPGVVAVIVGLICHSE